MGSRRGEENHVITIYGHAADAGGLAKDALAPVPIDGVTKTLWRDEGDPSGVAFVASGYAYTQEGVVNPLPTGEDQLKITLGLDGLHALLFRR